MHGMASGFPVDRDEERCLDALETLAVQLAATPELTVPDGSCGTR